MNTNPRTGPCATCKNIISVDAKVCPHCGAKGAGHTNIVAIVIACIVGASTMLFVFSGGLMPASHRAAATPSPQATVAAPVVSVAPKPAEPPEDFTTLPEKYAYSQENVEGFCTEQWTKRGTLDEQMFRYCVAQEKSGHAELAPIAKKWGKLPFFSRMFPQVWDEWTKRGVTQYRMVAHTMKQETDAALDIEYEEKQPTYRKAAMEACYDQWNRHPHAFTMMRYCYKKGQ